MRGGEQSGAGPLADLGKYKARGAELVRHSASGPDEIYDAHGVLGTDGIVDVDRTPGAARSRG